MKPTNPAKSFPLEGPGVMALGAAIVARAVLDASAGDRVARAWLLCDGPLWLDCLGLNPDAIGLEGLERAVTRGRPEKAYRHHNHNHKREMRSETTAA